MIRNGPQAELAGDVILAFIGDEESGEPGTGVSAGMKAFLPVIGTAELPKPDFAIYVEPTTLDVYPAQMVLLDGGLEGVVTLIGDVVMRVVEDPSDLALLANRRGERVGSLLTHLVEVIGDDAN